MTVWHATRIQTTYGRPDHDDDNDDDGDGNGHDSCDRDELTTHAEHAAR